MMSIFTVTVTVLCITGPDDIPYPIDGNRVISLSRLGKYIQSITSHSAICLTAVEFLGESSRSGLASVLISRCSGCMKKFRLTTCRTVKVGKSSHFAVNVGAVLGEISTGGGQAHLEEQLACIEVPAICQRTFTRLERELGQVIETEVTVELVKAGEEERKLAIERNEFDEDVPAIPVVVDGGWSKRSHKHSYNANSGVGVIFGATTKKLLYVGVRNKYCCVCSIASNKGVEAGSHTCFKNWSGTSCGMELDIITEGFQRSEQMHKLRFTQLVGDGDSSVFYSVALNVTYGRRVKKVECANHAIKCYRSHLEALLKDNPQYQGRGGLTKATVKRITAGTHSAIKNHSKTGDVNALRHEIRNGPRHCLGDHSKCVLGGFCHHAPQQPSTGKTHLQSHIQTKYYTYTMFINYYLDSGNSSSMSSSPSPSSSEQNSTDVETTPLDNFPPGLLRSLEAAGDRLVSKSVQLIQDKTTNLSESYMSVRNKMDGGKFYNRIQSGSFQVRCMAAALRLQLGPDWVAKLWQRQFDNPDEVMLKFGRSRKRKHVNDCARKISDKYKRQRLAKRHQLTAVTSQPDHTYGKNSAEPDLEPTALKTLCKEYLGRLTVTEEQSAQIASRTVLQAEDITGEWELQRKGRLTALHFGEVAKRRAAYTPLLPVSCMESSEGPRQLGMATKMKKWLDKLTPRFLLAAIQALRYRKLVFT